MYFCPKCSYILDIGKIENAKKEIKKTINNVSNIIKMILADEILDEFNFNIEINNLEKNSKYKKLSENDRIKVYNKITENLYLNKSSNIDNLASFICNNCNYNKEITNSITLYKRSYDKSNTNTSYDVNTNELLKNDPTLPRTRNYSCKNVNCLTNDPKNKNIEKEAIFFRDNDFDIKYLCTVCNHSWTN